MPKKSVAILVQRQEPTYNAIVYDDKDSGQDIIAALTDKNNTFAYEAILNDDKSIDFKRGSEESNTEYTLHLGHAVVFENNAIKLMPVQVFHEQYMQLFDYEPPVDCAETAEQLQALSATVKGLEDTLASLKTPQKPNSKATKTEQVTEEPKEV